MSARHNCPARKAFRATITKSAQEPEFSENIAGVLLTLSKNVLKLWLLGAFGEVECTGFSPKELAEPSLSNGAAFPPFR
jgi:hypothetical protein